DVYRAICREFHFGITGTHSWAHPGSSYSPFLGWIPRPSGELPGNTLSASSPVCLKINSLLDQTALIACANASAGARSVSLSRRVSSGSRLPHADTLLRFGY